MPFLPSAPSTIGRDSRLNRASNQYDGRGLRRSRSTQEGSLISLLPPPRDFTKGTPLNQTMVKNKGRPKKRIGLLTEGHGCRTATVSRYPLPSSPLSLSQSLPYCPDDTFRFFLLRHFRPLLLSLLFCPSLPILSSHSFVRHSSQQKEWRPRNQPVNTNRKTNNKSKIT